MKNTIKLTPQSVAESLGPQLLDGNACRKWVIEATRGDEPCCPFCGERFNLQHAARLFSGCKVLCKQCSRHSSPRTGTIFEGSTLSDSQIVFILSMIYWDLPVSNIAAMAGCGERTVYDWRNRFRNSAS